MQQRVLLSLAYCVSGALFFLALAGLCVPWNSPSQIVLPILKNLFSPDGIIALKTIMLLDNFLLTNSALLIAVGIAILFFAHTRQAINNISQASIIPNKLSKPSSAEIITLIAILCSGAALRLLMMNRGFSYDELFISSRYLSRESFMPIINEFWPTNHISYTLLAYCSTHCLGFTEWSARLPAFIFGTASIFTLWHLTRLFFSAQTALLAAGLLSLSPTHIIWSAAARGYSGYIFCALALVFIYLDLLRSPSHNKKIALILVSILGITMHLYFVFFLLAITIELVFSVILYKKKSPGSCMAWESIAWTALISCTIMLPITIRTLLDISPPPGQPMLNFQFILNIIPQILATPSEVTLLLAISLIGIGLWSAKQHVPRFISILFILIGFILAIWLYRPLFIFTRFWAGMLPLLIILISEGVHKIHTRNPWGKTTAFIIYTIILISPLATLQANQSAIVNENSHLFREASQYAISTSWTTTAFGAFGSGGSLFQVYADRPLTFISTLDQVKLFTDSHNSYCFFTIPRFIDNSTPEDLAILRILTQTSKQNNFGDVAVFCHQVNSAPSH